jgi:hypothetical protein
MLLSSFAGSGAGRVSVLGEDVLGDLVVVSELWCGDQLASVTVWTRPRARP